MKINGIFDICQLKISNRYNYIRKPFHFYLHSNDYAFEELWVCWLSSFLKRLFQRTSDVGQLWELPSEWTTNIQTEALFLVQDFTTKQQKEKLAWL